MKNKKLLLVLLTILIISLYSCDSNPCDEGYTLVKENGSSYCLPDYVVGIEKSIEYGNRFYHNEYGIIEFEKGEWKNQIGENITDLLRGEN